MDSHTISVTITAGDGSWTATWSAQTGAEPHQVSAMARDLVNVAGSAAAGAWSGEQVRATVDRIGRQHSTLPSAAYVAMPDPEQGEPEGVEAEQLSDAAIAHDDPSLEFKPETPVVDPSDTVQAETNALSAIHDAHVAHTKADEPTEENTKPTEESKS